MQIRRDSWFILFGLTRKGYSWQGIWLLLALFLGSLLIAGVLSPLFFWAYEVIQNQCSDDLTAYFIKKGLPKTFDRLRWLPILIGFPWLMHYCGLLSWQRMGLSFDRSKQFFVWFALGLFMLMFIALMQWLSGNWGEVKSVQLSAIPAIIFSALLGGLLIGLLEESLFRGLVLRLFYSAVRPLPAVLLSAAFFAWLHFKKVPPELWTSETEVFWWSGLYLCFWTVMSLVLTFNLPLFLNLMMTGILLNMVYIRYKSLWPGIGLHAGWVVFIITFKDLVDVVYRGWTGILFGTERFIDGLMPGLIMGGLVVWLYCRSSHGEESLVKRNHESD